MSTAVISGLIGAVAATFLASYFSNRPAQISYRTGRRRLYYSVALRALAIALGSILILATFHVMTQQPDDVLLHLVMGLFTLFAGGYLIVETNFASIEFDDTEIQVNSPWGRSKVTYWNEIESVREGIFTSTNSIRTRTGGRILVDNVMSGSGEFLDRCKWQVRRKEFG